MTENTAVRKPKGRSPAYPAINLETAIQRARQLYDKERHHPTPVATIASHWGYASLNGAALGAIAALKKFGLLDEEGSSEDRKARLSRLADDILSNPDETRRTEAIKEAALRPAIYREMWDTYHLDLPSDQTLRWELTRDRGFTERGATEFIRAYKATITFAQLEDPSRAAEPAATPDTQRVEDHRDEGTGDSQPERPTDRQRHPAGEKARSYAIPLIDNGAVVVEGQFPITERDWEQFMGVLNAMKRGLVAASPDEGSEAKGLAGSAGRRAYGDRAQTYGGYRTGEDQGASR
jgi:hypothetical protein